METTKSNDDRDLSALHQRMIAERQVHPDVLTSWEQLNHRCELAGQVPVPPPWAYSYYGGRLQETPSMPGSAGYMPPDDINAEDMEEIREWIEQRKKEEYDRP